jgi:VanZ family protein
MLNMKTIFIILFWALIATTTFLLLLEVKPVPQTWPKDKLQHAIIFALLTYIGIKSYPKYVLYICLGLAVYGVSMELLQSQLTLTRSGNIADWLADIVGIALGLIALNWHKKSRITS